MTKIKFHERHFPAALLLVHCHNSSIDYLNHFIIVLSSMEYYTIVQNVPRYTELNYNYYIILDILLNIIYIIVILITNYCFIITQLNY